MTAFPNYYRGKPTIDRIVWKSYPDRANCVGGDDARRDRLSLRSRARSRRIHSKEKLQSSCISIPPQLRVPGRIQLTKRPTFRRSASSPSAELRDRSRRHRRHGRSKGTALAASGPAWPLALGVRFDRSRVTPTIPPSHCPLERGSDSARARRTNRRSASTAPFHVSRSREFRAVGTNGASGSARPRGDRRGHAARERAVRGVQSTNRLPVISMPC